jgi:hypothetical protein
MKCLILTATLILLAGCTAFEQPAHLQYAESRDYRHNGEGRVVQDYPIPGVCDTFYLPAHPGYNFGSVSLRVSEWHLCPSDFCFAMQCGADSVVMFDNDESDVLHLGRETWFITGQPADTGAMLVVECRDQVPGEIGYWEGTDLLVWYDLRRTP